MTSSTEGGNGHHSASAERQPVYEVLPPVLGRESPASAEAGKLRNRGTASSAGYRADGGDSELLSLRAATVAGARHRLAGIGNEDDYGWAWARADIGGRAGNEQLVIAVADGVGSAPRAAEGASLAVAEACGHVVRRLAAGDAADEGLCRGAIDRANQVLLELGGAEGRELATTLVVVVVVPAEDLPELDGIGGMDVYLARVGDSTAMITGPDGWEELFWAGLDVDELALTATEALPALLPAVELSTRHVPAGVGLLMMTDGIANPLRDGPSTVAPALAAALVRPPTPLTMAALADFARQGCHDDRTMVGVWRRSGASQPRPEGPTGPGD